MNIFRVQKLSIQLLIVYDGEFSHLYIINDLQYNNNSTEDESRVSYNMGFHAISEIFPGT